MGKACCCAGRGELRSGTMLVIMRTPGTFHQAGRWTPRLPAEAGVTASGACMSAGAPQAPPAQEALGQRRAMRWTLVHKAYRRQEPTCSFPSARSLCPELPSSSCCSRLARPCPACMAIKTNATNLSCRPSSVLWRGVRQSDPCPGRPPQVQQMAGQNGPDWIREASWSSASIPDSQNACVPEEGAVKALADIKRILWPGRDSLRQVPQPLRGSRSNLCAVGHFCIVRSACRQLGAQCHISKPLQPL